MRYKDGDSGSQVTHIYTCGMFDEFTFSIELVWQLYAYACWCGLRWYCNCPLCRMSREFLSYNLVLHQSYRLKRY